MQVVCRGDGYVYQKLYFIEIYDRLYIYIYIYIFASAFKRSSFVSSEPSFFVSCKRPISKSFSINASSPKLALYCVVGVRRFY
jgi:hypothetical protein